MNGLRLRHAAHLRVEPSNELRPLVTLDQIESGSGRLIGEPVDSPADGQIRFEPGDVLFSKLRPYLAKSARITTPSHGSGELLAMVADPPLLAPEYLLYLTLSQGWLDLADLTSYGTKMPRTSWEAMSDFVVPIAGVDEQRRIADFLDDQTMRLDQIIAARRQQLSLVESELWSEAARLFDSEPRVPLRYLVSEARVGIVIRPSDYYTEDEDGIPALRGTDVHPFRVSGTDLVKITPAGDALNARSKLRQDDVVLVRTGDAGAAARVPAWASGFNAIDLVILRTADSAVPAYLEFAVNAARWGAHVNAASAGSIQQHFGVNSALGLSVPALSYEEQLRTAAGFARFRALVEEGQRALGESIGLLQEFKRSLISAAVSGEFDVSASSGRGVPA